PPPRRPSRRAWRSSSAIPTPRSGPLPPPRWSRPPASRRPPRRSWRRWRPRTIHRRGSRSRRPISALRGRELRELRAERVKPQRQRLRVGPAPEGLLDDRDRAAEEDDRVRHVAALGVEVDEREPRAEQRLELVAVLGPLEP